LVNQFGIPKVGLLALNGTFTYIKSRYIADKLVSKAIEDRMHKITISKNG